MSAIDSATGSSKSDSSTAGSSTAGTPFDVAKVRADFPILARTVYGKPLVYLDNAATTQKPNQVIDRIVKYYSEENSNIHRGVHYLSQVATKLFEDARLTVKNFIGASRPEEIIFTRGSTEGINLVANSYLKPRLKEGDEIVITAMEHHSDIVPYQLVCEATGAKLRVAPVNDDGELLMDEYRALLNERTRFVGTVHISNALGTVNPVKEMVAEAKKFGAAVLIDGAQAAAHEAVDVQDIGCDFYVFSGHKIYAPTGIGVLYGRYDLLDAMPPYEGGGEMILSVSFDKTIYNKVPAKFEAGTPNIAGGIALATALDYVSALGLDRIAAYEAELLRYGTEKLEAIDGLTLIGRAKNKASILGFTLNDVHPHDIGTILDQEGVAVRAGHHCAQPVMERFGVPATVRASIAVYTTKEEIDRLVDAVGKVREVFS